MPTYWIAHVTVTDEAAYSEYAKRAGPALAAFGGRFLARNGRFRQFEGSGHARNVVAEFPDFESAEACYESDAYQEALGFARNSSERDLVIVEGV